MGDLKIEGLEDIERKFKKLTKDAYTQATSPAATGLKAGANVFKVFARAFAPSDEGTLQRSIKVRRLLKKHRKSPIKGFLEYETFADRKIAWWAYLVEHGTGYGGPLGKGKARGNKIKPRKGKILADGFGRFSTEVKGQRAQPFMRVAFHAKGRAAIKVFERAYLKRLDKLVKKAGLAP